MAVKLKSESSGIESGLLVFRRANRQEHYLRSLFMIIKRFIWGFAP